MILKLKHKTPAVEVKYYPRLSIPRTDLGGGYRGSAPPPLPHEMKASSSYSLIKFVYLASQLRHSLVVGRLLRKILDLPQMSVI